MDGLAIFLASVVLIGAIVAAVVVVVVVVWLVRTTVDDRKNADDLQGQVDDMGDRLARDERVAVGSVATVAALGATVELNRTEVGEKARGLLSSVSSHLRTAKITLARKDNDDGTTGSSLNMLPPTSTASQVAVNYKLDGNNWVHLTDTTGTTYNNLGIGELRSDTGISMANNACVVFDSGASMCPWSGTGTDASKRVVSAGPLQVGNSFTLGVDPKDSTRVSFTTTTDDQNYKPLSVGGLWVEGGAYAGSISTSNAIAVSNTNTNQLGQLIGMDKAGGLASVPGATHMYGIPVAGSPSTVGMGFLSASGTIDDVLQASRDPNTNAVTVRINADLKLCDANGANCITLSQAQLQDVGQPEKRGGFFSSFRRANPLPDRQDMAQELQQLQMDQQLQQQQINRQAAVTSSASGSTQPLPGTASGIPPPISSGPASTPPASGSTIPSATTTVAPV